jgi:predicted NAD/FAD-dependent oxidoreductase
MKSDMPKADITHHADCVVVGAGISGLMAARTLTSNGLDVLVLDKGRGVGGRMATRWLNSHRFDHGAQSFFCTQEGLAVMATQWLRSGVLRPCEYPGIADGAQVRVGPVCGVGGINSVPASLATNLNVKTSCRVTQLRWSGSSWLLGTDGGIIFTTGALVMTPPMPQSLDILQRGDVGLPVDIIARLTKITYEPCLALMALYDTSQPILPTCFVQIDDSPVALIVDNFAKGVSLEAGAVTFHTTREFSERNWDASDDEISVQVLEAARSCLPQKPVLSTVHRWRYSRTIISHPEKYELVEEPGLLAFAGDGFFGTDIEGAALSGIGAAEAILSKIR